MFILLTLFIAALQTILITFQHYTPFERESNLRAVLWGARPAPKYYAAAALDGLVGVLISLLLYGLLPHGGAGAAGWAQSLPWFILAGLASAGAHHFLNAGIIRFPRYEMMARPFIPAMLLGGLALGAGWMAALTALAESGARLQAGQGVWMFGLALLLGAGVFILRSLAYLFRILPVVGDFLSALAGTLLLAGLYDSLGQLAWQASTGNGPYPGASYSGLEGPLLALAGVAFLAAVFTWRLPGMQRGEKAVDPPELVIQPAQDIPVTARMEAGQAVLEGPQRRWVVQFEPFQARLEDAQGEVLWSLAENGVGQDLVFQKILAIPFLYTGNTIKFKWTAARRSARGPVQVEAHGDALRVHFPKDGLALQLAFHNAESASVELSQKKKPWLPWIPALTMTGAENTHYLGFGQRFDRVDQGGQELYFFVEEGGVGYQARFPWMKRFFGERGSFPNGEGCTGFPVPFGLLAREAGPSAGLFWAIYAPSWLDLRQAPQARLSVLDQRIQLYILSGPTPLEAVQQYTALTGRSAPPPAWALLPWKTRTGAVVEADVLEDIHRFRELGIPLAQVGVEHWMEIRGSYEFSQQWYPHIDQVIAAARENGYRITIWHFPYMNAGAATHLEGVRKGYFLRNRLGLPYQQRIFHGLACVVDYSNPEAAAWHGELVAERLYRRGFSGAMTDYAESIPPDCVFYNGASGLAMRNAYPVMYVQAMQAAAQAALGEDHIIYPRAGYAGSQRFVTLQWPGDQDTDWDEGDGLPAAVRAMLNVSMCGFPVHGSDIGGWYDWFSPITSKELFIRWAEVGAYSPLMRAHGGPIGRNREPWKFDEETVAIYRQLSEEHVLLFPYLQSLADEAAACGTPIVRHPALVWPGVPELFGVEDAWMLGEALYVAPVIRPGQTRRELFLPPGEWWDLNASCPRTGGQTITVEAPLGQTPRFLRQGYPLPRFTQALDTFDFSPKARCGSLDDPVEVWLYPARNGAAPAPGENACAPFKLFDGTSLAWQDGWESTPPTSARLIRWKLFGTNIPNLLKE